MLCEDCAVTNEIDNEIDKVWTNIPGIHDNGPCDRGVWRLTLTAYMIILGSFCFYFEFQVWSWQLFSVFSCSCTRINRPHIQDDQQIVKRLIIGFSLIITTFGTLHDTDNKYLTINGQVDWKQFADSRCLLIFCLNSTARMYCIYYECLLYTCTCRLSIIILDLPIWMHNFCILIKLVIHYMAIQDAG